jgi:hypothetical protein
VRREFKSYSNLDVEVTQANSLEGLVDGDGTSYFFDGARRKDSCGLHVARQWPASGLPVPCLWHKPASGTPCASLGASFGPVCVYEGLLVLGRLG